MYRHVETAVHPALATDAAAERNCHQATIEAIAPLVINARVLGGVTRQLAPDKGAAMGASIDECVYRAIGVPVHDNRGFADIGGTEIAAARDLGLEAEKIPGRPAEDPL